MDPREQLLQSLMRDLEGIRLPERYTEAQKAEIKRGRKGQEQIDRGRAQIEENERAYNQAITQRQELQKQISTLVGEIDIAKRQKGTDDTAATEQAYRQSFAGRAEDIGKVAGPITAGIGAGHVGARMATGTINSALGGRYENLKGIADDVRGNPVNFDDPVSRGRGAGAVRAAQPFMPPRGRAALPEMGGRALAYGLPAAALAYEGLQLRGPAAEGAKSPLERDLYRMGGTGMLAAGGGMAFEGGMRSIFGRTPKDVGRDVSTIHGLEEGLRNTEGRPPPPPPPPDGPTLRTPSDRLTAAARAAGATGKLTKATAASYLAANVTPENRAAVATELGVGPGQKITSAIKKLSLSRKPSMIVGPMIAAGMGYDAVSSEAEAAGATPAEARTRGAVAGTGAAAVTGGAMYAGSKLPALGRVLGPATSALAAYGYADEAKGFRDAMPPEQRGEPSSLLAHAMPAAMRGAGDIASIARAPGRLRDAAVSAFTPGNATPQDYQGSVYPEGAASSPLAAYGMKRAAPLSNAAALQIPEGIPLPREDGSSPYAEAQPARAASGDQRFDDALQAWLGMIQEHNSSLQGAQ